MKFSRRNKGKIKRLVVEKWFWVANIPIALGVYLLLPDVWDKGSVLYLLLLSLQTQVRTVDGDIEAARGN